MKLDVQHNAEASRFEATVEGQLAVVEYERVDKTLHVHHTKVPQALEGRGIASALVQAVFDHASAEGLQVDPICSYVQAWSQRHPEVAPLLVDSAG
jgi:predicted GNAT family acetyltransferase